MKSKVTLSLLLVGILIQCLASLHPSVVDRLALSPALSLLCLVRLFTHMLAHAGWGHLIGNFSFGLPFMLYLESRLGSKKFLVHYVACGIGSACLFALMTGGAQGMIGSSGAIMGASIGACLEFGDTKKMHVLGLVMALCLFIPQLAMAPLQDLLGVAIYGHVGGALTAMLLASRLMQPPKV
jgi:membrane associated rhomboid family serine protease